MVMVIYYKASERIVGENATAGVREKGIQEVFIQYPRNPDGIIVGENTTYRYKDLEELFAYLQNQDFAYQENEAKEEFRKRLAYRIQQWNGTIVENPMDNLQLFRALIETNHLFEHWALRLEDAYIGSKDLWNKR